MTRRTYTGVDVDVDGQRILTLTAPGYTAGGPLVMVGHGFAADHTFYQPPDRRRDLELLAETGCVVVIADLGSNAWCNDDFLDAADTAIAYAADRYSADVSRVAWVGDSMNGAGALNWRWRHPTTGGPCALRLPSVALDALHDRDEPAGIAAAMEGAYGGESEFEAAMPTRDPSHPDNTALIAAFADDIRIWHSTDDPVILPADITAFVAATGVRAIPLGEVAHDPALVYPAIHAHAQAEWIWSRL
jgi:hypothetical protein